MSTTLTLGDLFTRAAIQAAIGYKGSFTSPPSGTTIADNYLVDPDTTWDNAILMNLVSSSASTGTVQTYLQPGQITLFNALTNGGTSGDAYLLVKMLNVNDLIECVNSGLTTCGRALRNFLYQQDQYLTANVYQYTPTYGTGGFWPGQVIRCEFQYWNGQVTRAFIEITGWYNLDDEVLQFPSNIVDRYAGNLIRFTGFGPVCSAISNASPLTVIGTFDDPEQIEYLVAAVKASIFGLLAAKAPPSDAARYRQLQADSLAQCNDMKKKFARVNTMQRTTLTPIGPVSG